jgi:hypothetical protein
MLILGKSKDSEDSEESLLILMNLVSLMILGGSAGSSGSGASGGTRENGRAGLLHLLTRRPIKTVNVESEFRRPMVWNAV